MKRIVRSLLLLSMTGIVTLSLFTASSSFERMLDIAERAIGEPEVATQIVEVPVAVPTPAPVQVNTNVNVNTTQTTQLTAPHGGSFAATFDSLFSERTCTVQTSPAGAAVWRKNLFGEPEYLGVTPLSLDRPLRSEKVYLQAPGYQTAEAWLIPSSSHQSCNNQLQLMPATG